MKKTIGVIMVLAGAGLLISSYNVMHPKQKALTPDEQRSNRTNSIYLGFAGIAIGGIGAVFLSMEFAKG